MSSLKYVIFSLKHTEIFFEQIAVFLFQQQVNVRQIETIETKFNKHFYTCFC